MNQITIGKFIARKRKEKNITQEQLAEKLSVSNKTVSKWETGRCMPDYSVIEMLCSELDITISELMDGKEDEGNGIREYDENQIIDLIKRTQSLEKQKYLLISLIYLSVGSSIGMMSDYFNGSHVSKIISICIAAVSVGISVLGLLYAIKYVKELK